MLPLQLSSLLLPVACVGNYSVRTNSCDILQHFVLDLSSDQTDIHVSLYNFLGFHDKDCIIGALFEIIDIYYWHNSYPYDWICILLSEWALICSFVMKSKFCQFDNQILPKYWNLYGLFRCLNQFSGHCHFDNWNIRYNWDCNIERYSL